MDLLCNPTHGCKKAGRDGCYNNLGGCLAYDEAEREETNLEQPLRTCSNGAAFGVDMGGENLVLIRKAIWEAKPRE